MLRGLVETQTDLHLQPVMEYMVFNIKVREPTQLYVFILSQSEEEFRNVSDNWN